MLGQQATEFFLMWRNVSLGVAAIAASGAASAQHQIVIDRLNQLTANAPAPDEAALVGLVTMAAKRHAQARQLCVPQNVEVKDVASIAGSGGLFRALLSGQIRNAWTVYATHLDCPGTNAFRYMIVQEASGRMQIAPVNEGRSLANPSIMLAAERQIAVAIMAKAQLAKLSCDQNSVRIGATRITGQSKDLGPETYGVRYTGSWTEAWQVEACGGTNFEVPIQFTADGDGGAYINVRANNVRVMR